MDITVYLPDEIGKRAKEARLNLSGLLREAVTEELDRRETMDAALAEAQVYELTLEDRDGRVYIGNLTGKMLCEAGDCELYLRAEDETRDAAVILYDASKRSITEVEEPEDELRDRLNETDYIEAMHALGITPKVDI